MSPKKTLVVLQPSFLPWLGYFEQMHQSDIFVYYDDVQYTKNDWRNRNRIKTPDGAAWITVPAQYSFPSLIKDVRIDAKAPWKQKHLQAVRQNYSRAPYFEECFGLLESVYARPWDLLVDLDLDLMGSVMKVLRLDRHTVRSSSLGIVGDRSERLANLCDHFGASRYYSGASAQDYLDMDLFRKRGIEVQFQDYRHPAYSQLHGDFVSHLSILDLIMNHGPQSMVILTGKNHE